jgi:hypothetical protein
MPSKFCASPVLAACATAGTATTNTIDFLNLSPLVVLSRSLADRSRSIIAPEVGEMGILVKEFLGTRVVGSGQTWSSAERAATESPGYEARANYLEPLLAAPF